MKRQIILIMALVAFIVVLILVSRSAASQGLAAGQKLAAEKCARCHAIDLNDNIPLGSCQSYLELVRGFFRRLSRIG